MKVTLTGVGGGFVPTTVTFPKAVSFAGFPLRPLTVKPYCTNNPVGIALTELKLNAPVAVKGSVTLKSVE